MKTTRTYTLTMRPAQASPSQPKPITIEAASATDAMMIALQQNPGKTILSCCSGNPSFREGGYIEYEIPPHQPPSPKTKPTPETESAALDFDFTKSQPGT